MAPPLEMRLWIPSNRAFAVMHEQYRNEDWMPAGKEAIAAQIAEGFAQAERGELVDADQASYQFLRR